MQRNTGNTESLTIEYGFLDSKGDDVGQLKNNWKNYAEAVVRAIIEYINLTYIPVENIQNYTVKQGDTLWSIAKKYNINVTDLKKANRLKSSNLKLGQILQIPILNEIAKEDNIYVVKKGDTLYKIAQNFGTTVNDIIKTNNLTKTLLNIGQVLEIPININNASKNFYIIKAGDTLYKIANDNNTTVSQIKLLNNLNTDILSIGQKIKLK